MVDINKTRILVMMSVYVGDRPLAFYYAVKSILDQTYKNLVVCIFVDGKLNHNLYRVVELFETNVRINVVFSLENVGLAKALNTIIDANLEGEQHLAYFCRMDSDDIAHLNRFEKQIDYLENHNAVDVVGGNCIEFGKSNYVSSKFLSHYDIVEKFVVQVPFIHPTVVFRRRVFESGIRYPEESYLTEDLFLWIKLINRGFTLANIPDVVLSFRVTNSTYLRRASFRKAYCELCARLEFIVEHRVISMRNIALAITIFMLKSMPASILKLSYKIRRYFRC